MMSDPFSTVISDEMIEKMRTETDDAIKRAQMGGGSAFPTKTLMPYGGTYVSAGMTLRDHFAGQALAAFGAAFLDGGWHNPNDYQIEQMAAGAYRTADAMLKARTS